MTPASPTPAASRLPRTTPPSAPADGQADARHSGERYSDARHPDARLRDVLGVLSAVAVQLDAAGAVTFVNDTFLDVTGWVRAEVLGAEWCDGFVPAGCGTQATFAAALGGEAARGEGELFTRDGDRRLVAWDAVPLRDAAGRPAGATCVGRDVTDERRVARERARLARELAALADHDALTGLPNRRAFVRGTEHATRVAARTRRADAVLAVRLGDLAAAYAAHGAAATDDAVCAVAETLRAAVRDSDVVARVADDTFAVYAVGTAAPNHAEAVTRRLRAALATQDARARLAGRAFDLACAVGAAEREPGEAVEVLLARAVVAAVVDELSAPDGRAARG